MTLFAAEDLAINFGGIRALDGVSFAVELGQVFTIIGPNGAGKTTIFNLISRIYDPSQGRLTFAGEDITRVPPHDIARRGIARTFQNIELFEHATVLQNLLLGRHVHKRTRFTEELLFLPRVRSLEMEHREAAEKVIDFLDLQPYRDSFVVNLSYDVRKVVTAIVDDHDVLWIKPDWAKNVVTGLARIGGRSVGMVANQPMVLGGALDVNAADKAARFVWLCDAFNIPLVFLHDVPGFIVGSAVEKQGIIRHGAKMLFAVSDATVPKVGVVMRKSYGAGYFVMNGYAYEPDYLVAWPTAEIAVMGPDGAVNIIHRRTLESVPESEQQQKRLELAEEIRANIDPYVAAGHALVDDVIDPADTRTAIWRGLEVAAHKQVTRPWRKHGVLPV